MEIQRTSNGHRPKRQSKTSWLVNVEVLFLQFFASFVQAGKQRARGDAHVAQFVYDVPAVAHRHVDCPKVLFCRGLLGPHVRLDVFNVRDRRSFLRRRNLAVGQADDERRNGRVLRYPVWHSHHRDRLHLVHCQNSGCGVPVSLTRTR